MANNDNQMTRFLFAILRQKCLKDIDWNEVARDPILAQPITNGHAARMRYSRFKSAMLGLEPQKRAAKNAGVTKTKSSKAKKEPKTKQEDTIKSEHRDKLSGVKREASPQKHGVKQERKHHATPFHSQFTPVSMMDSPTDLQARLLTPCSDGSPNLLMTPASDLLSAGSTFDMGHCDHSHSEQDSWADPPLFSAFDAAYDIEGYGDAMHGNEALGHSHEFSADDLLEAAASSIHVKSEAWDSQFL
ncbi:uncharacterized protein DNG_08437 [Cephalotrichum gorgonifer]|uniref:Myb-like DNA-binding domain-containing protein n=1 Tax=Cephalotrichum gorgonifer TaxID=2041049 RepID=A0AAE8N3R8_9PEZI|nr:uncharacterized protein DNG_08437 [Cephalotrichum gorgonifer]